jgi:UDP-glucose 4-epimerase
MVNPTSPLKILVTGASGFLGGAVARAAKAKGYDVLGVGRQQFCPPLATFGVSYQALDISDDAALERYLETKKPDIIVHAGWNGVAGRYKDQDVQYANIVPTCRLIELGAEYGLSKFIGIGSQAEYGQYEGPIAEDAPTNPTTLYGAAKLAASVLARQRAQDLGVEFAWMRLFAIYGPGDKPHWLIPSLITSLAKGETLPLTQGRQKCDYLYIDDAAEAVLAVARNEAAQGTFNFCSGASVSVADIVARLRDLVAPKTALEFGTVPYANNQIFNMQGDTSKLRAATCWQPKVSLSDGLALTVQSQLVTS